MSSFVVDTHALVWYLEKDLKLSKRAREILNSAEAALIIPTIVLAELKYLFSKKKIRVSLARVMETLDTDPRVRIRHFDLACVEALDPGFNLHDAMIVATAIVFRRDIDPETAIITKDRQIQDSGIIDTVW